MVTTAIAVQTSKQIAEYLLCAGCEDRFNKGGESWVFQNCWHSESTFPLHSALRSANPAYDNNGFIIYPGRSIVGINVDKLVYFGASVFWRAAVHQWKAEYDPPPIKLRLGPYEEGLRRYLLGLTSFPDNTVIVVTVNSTMKSGRNEFLVFPFLKNQDRKFNQFRFSIPGVLFQLFTGNAIPASVRGLCTARSANGYVFMALTMDDHVMSDMAKLLGGARMRGALK